MPSIAAVILAGGRGERLGGMVKANLMVGGARLLERVAGRLAPANPVVVSRGPHEAEVLPLLPDQVGVADLRADYAGPMAGFAAAVAQLQAAVAPPEFVVTSAVDIPFLPADYLERLTAGIGDAAVAVAAFDGQPCPTNALWRLAAVATLPRQVLEGTAPHSLKRLIAGVRSVAVEWNGRQADDPFAGINTPEELAAAQARAAREAADRA